MSGYQKCKEQLQASPKTWLITGVAGFIGSNLLEALLLLDQNVVGLDNFSTGFQKNLDEVKSLVSRDQWTNFKFIQGDIRDLSLCIKACSGVDYILHQAALGSVPRSVTDPIATHETNITGFLNILVAARDEKVSKFVYAASSSTYGDHPDLPKVEEFIGKPLSPYAVTKYMNELYADVFARCYGYSSIGLRYFNVFGPRQNPNGAYSAVIPRWINQLTNREPVFINGDGETTRDFCFIDNAVQANILAATLPSNSTDSQIFNIAFGEQITLNKLFFKICEILFKNNFDPLKPIYQDFREGDIRHSLADISKARSILGYDPDKNVEDGLRLTIPWYSSD